VSKSPIDHSNDSKSRVDFDQDFTILGSCVQVDTSTEDAMNDWMSNPLPEFQNFADSTFDDLLTGQTPFLSMDVTGSWASTFNEPPPKGVDGMIQARKQANMSRTIKNISNLADNLPSQPSSFDGFGYSNNGHLNFEILEPQSERECIRKLSQLSADLFEHGHTIPPMSIYEPPPVGNGDHGVPQENQGGQDLSKYSVSETLRLTQSLIDIYPAFLNAFLPHPTSQSSNASSAWSSGSMSNTYFQNAQHTSTSSTASPHKRSPQSLDHSSILLILSCHLRLLSIYEALFTHMQTCYDQRGVPKSPHEASLQVPLLKIGDFVPPPSAAIPMQMLLVVQFASQLFNYAADLAAEIREPESGTPQSDSSSESSSNDTLALTRAAAENVKARASNMAQELKAMRILMLQSGHLA